MKKMNQVLFLDVSNIIQIIKKHGIIPIINDVMNEIESDYLNWDQFQKSPRTVNSIEEGVIELMPISNQEKYSFKYVNGHPKNLLYDLPTIMAVGMLADMKTGIPLLLCDLTILTAIRTAATSALIAKKVAKTSSKTMAVIGNGCQSEFQILAFYSIIGIKDFRLYDTDPTATIKLMKNMKKYEDIHLIMCFSTEEAVLGADIITTITADKKNAIIIDEKMISFGQHYNAVGGDCHGKTELSSSILKKATVYVEFEEQTRIEGEIQQMDSSFPVIEIASLLKNPSLGRKKDDEITVFDSVGFALEDYSALHFIYKLAKEDKIGTYIDLIPKLDDSKDLFGILE
jgi:ornithine cyclodeaminase